MQYNTKVCNVYNTLVPSRILLHKLSVITRARKLMTLKTLKNEKKCP
jgi:hypothetical protein